MALPALDGRGSAVEHGGVGHSKEKHSTETRQRWNGGAWVELAAVALGNGAALARGSVVRAWRRWRHGGVGRSEHREHIGS